MKVAVSAQGRNLDATVDPRFGRSMYFVIIETDDMTFEAVENPNVALGGGAGIQSAQLLASKDVRFVLTGNCGPNAHQTLSAVGIGVAVGCSGTVQTVVEQFKSGALKASAQPNVTSHFGTATNAGPSPDSPRPQDLPPVSATPGSNTAAGIGGGRGRGRGMGRGMGRGRGMGGGGGMGACQPTPAQAPPAGRQEELAVLKQQAQSMIHQLQQIQDRMRQLEEENDNA